MTWPGFLVGSGAWLFLLLIPLVIFYFLKLRRPRLEIPSLALWRSVLNDRRVNSPFQRFKRNLLLLLQVLLLCCLALAAMQPFWPGGADRAEYLPVLIDTSASMGALDAEGGETRLDAARNEVRRLIDNLLPKQRLALIAVSSTARALTEFTDNKRVLHEALDRLQVTPVASRLEDALRMTQALARTVSIETAVLYTDGNVPPEVDFELPYTLNFQKLPPAGPNIGITAANARRSGTRWDVFARVDGSATAQIAANVELMQNGVRVGEDRISLDPGQSQRIVFHVESEGAASLEIRLKPESFDSLASDNVAYLDLPVSRLLTIYCPTELESYRHALKGLKDVLVYPDQEGKAGPVDYDLLLSDQKTDSEIEAQVAVFVGVVPDDLGRLVEVNDKEAEVVDWQRSAPLLQHVQLTDLQITERPTSKEGVRDRDFEELGYEILAQGRDGPLVLRKDASGRATYYFLFHTDRSTLPFRVGFPILVANAIQIAEQQAGLTEVRGQATGMLPPRVLSASTSYQITDPNGDVVDGHSNADGVLIGIAAPFVGRYSIREGAREVSSTGISLLTASESTLGSVDRLQFRELAVGASATMLQTDRPLWPYLAVTGFVLLIAEWWLFQKRPGGMPSP
jgi:hypothetical protein